MIGIVLAALLILGVYLIKYYWIKDITKQENINTFLTGIQVFNNFYGNLLLIVILGYALFNLPLRTWSKSNRTFIFYHYL